MDYASWKEATFGSGYMIWHEGLDVGAVTSLRGDARQQALTMLQVGLADGDAHAATALAAMGERSAVQTMHALLASSSGSARVRIALAIHHIDPDPSLSKHLIEVLNDTSQHWGILIDAAIGLRQFHPTITTEVALFEATSHDEYLVRYHAASTLLALWGVVPVEVDKHKQLFAAVCDHQTHVAVLLRQLQPLPSAP
jgi:HEAT repeat protein